MKILLDRKMTTAFLAGALCLTSVAATIDVTDSTYGAAGDGETKDTEAIQKAIDAARSGDTVLLKEGKVFLSGPITLKGDMTFQVDGTLLGSTEKDDYRPNRPNRWEGLIKQLPQSLITAGELDRSGKTNISNLTITGRGLIDPQGRELKRNGISINNAIQINNCDGFILKGESDEKRLHIREPARWCVHPIFSKNLLFQYLHIDTSESPRNGDGIDIDSCTQVVVRDCFIYAQDDCVVLKSGKGVEGYEINIPTSHVKIENNVFQCVKWSAVSIGTEASAGVHHVEVRNCTTGPKGTKKHFFYMKTNPSRGERSKYHDILVEDCHDLKTRSALTHVDTDVGIVYTDAPGHPDIGGNIVLRNLSTASNQGVNYNGSEEIAVHNITFENCDFGSGKIQGKYCRDLTFKNCKYGEKDFENSSNIVFED